jgi:peptidyl-prolyl cis-trans isomerase D
MAKKTKTAIHTKKHQARLERERRQTRFLLIGMIAVVVVVLGSIGYGVLEQKYLRNIRPVATVNGDKIATNDFQAYTRYLRQQMINDAINSYQLLQFFGNDSQTMAYVANQLYQIQSQLDPEAAGQHALDDLINADLIKQEAARRGIVFTKADIDIAVQEAFAYYPNGTPTPTTTTTWQSPATSTLSPTQYALVSATPTATATSVPTVTATSIMTATSVLTETAGGTPTITPTVGPTATPTPYTEQGFQTLYQDTLKNLQDNIDFSEENLRQIITMQLYQDKVKASVLAELNLPHEEEQVWARHILVSDEKTAQDIRARLENGEDWTTLAAEFSLDTSNKDNGGDLGWFGRGKMVSEFETAAFSLQIGEISQPVETQFGWHLIQVLGHETRPLTQAEYQQLETQKFNEFLTNLKDAAQIKIDDTWKNRVPDTPILPDQITQFIQQYLQSQQQSPTIATPAAP